jgi:hypothetical protein
MVLLEQLSSPPYRYRPATTSSHVGGQDRYELALIPSGGAGKASLARRAPIAEGDARDPQLTSLRDRLRCRLP